MQSIFQRCNEHISTIINIDPWKNITVFIKETIKVVQNELKILAQLTIFKNNKDSIMIDIDNLSEHVGNLMLVQDKLNNCLQVFSQACNNDKSEEEDELQFNSIKNTFKKDFLSFSTINTNKLLNTVCNKKYQIKMEAIIFDQQHIWFKLAKNTPVIAWQIYTIGNTGAKAKDFPD